jgi:hypothetical protein
MNSQETKRQRLTFVIIETQDTRENSFAVGTSSISLGPSESIVLFAHVSDIVILAFGSSSLREGPTRTRIRSTDKVMDVIVLNEKEEHLMRMMRALPREKTYTMTYLGPVYG